MSGESRTREGKDSTLQALLERIAVGTSSWFSQPMSCLRPNSTSCRRNSPTFANAPLMTVCEWRERTVTRCCPDQSRRAAGSRHTRRRSRHFGFKGLEQRFERSNRSVLASPGYQRRQMLTDPVSRSAFICGRSPSDTSSRISARNPAPRGRPCRRSSA